MQLLIILCNIYQTNKKLKYVMIIQILEINDTVKSYVCLVIIFSWQIFLQAVCLTGTVGRPGGATPGKALLGLRVITASAVVPVEGRPKETVLLYPGEPLNFYLALIRSLIKNFFISLLFPLCVVLFVFQFNRTAYDLLCGVIVVEENMFPPRRHAP